MPARITWSSPANDGINTLRQNGSWTNQNINDLQAAIRSWINSSYQRWTEGESNFRSFRVKSDVNATAELTNKKDGLVEVTRIEAN